MQMIKYKMKNSVVTRPFALKMFEGVGKIKLGLVMLEISFLKEIPRSMHSTKFVSIVEKREIKAYSPKMSSSINISPETKWRSNYI